MRRAALALITAACGGAAEDPGSRGSALIYGDDGRAEPEGAWATLADRRTVALGRQVQTDAAGRWIAPRLGDREELCPEERFLDQPSAASCSGVLVDDNTVLTAAHCVSAGCDGLTVVRGFRMVAGEAAVVSLHRCAGVRRLDPGADHALIAIDPPVTGAEPIEIGTATAGARVAALGHPLGLPVKVDPGGVITELGRRDFSAALDLYEGSSGSGVFDRQGRLLGIAVEGAADWELDPIGLCLRSRTATRAAERIVRAEEALLSGAAEAPAIGCRCSRSPPAPGWVMIALGLGAAAAFKLRGRRW